MSGVQLVIQSAQLNRAIKRSADACRNTRDYWTDMGIMMLRSVRRNFEVGGRPDPWEPLDPEYASWRAKHAPGKILVRSGTLMKSIAAIPDNKGVTLRTRAPHGVIHQYGGRAGRRGRSKIPARPFLVVQDKDRDMMVRSFERRVAKAWNG